MKPAVRRLESPDELAECVELQSLAWGLLPEDTVSAEILQTSIDHGALLIGAFQDEKLAGFCFSLPSLWRGAPAHHSHMLGVRPHLRDQGLGFLLKKTQFETLRSKVDWMTWTFDPLESRNARLNLKLGVTIGIYLRDLYGDGSECLLHKGLGTDRFIAEWNLKEEWKAKDEPSGKVMDIDTQTVVIKSIWDRDGYYRPIETDLTLTGPLLYLEIPADIQKIKTLDTGSAGKWRNLTRISFEHYFGIGYVIRRFRTWFDPVNGARRSFYVLEKESDG